jgi:hypothetical protein
VTLHGLTAKMLREMTDARLRAERARLTREISSKTTYLKEIERIMMERSLP